MDAADRESSRMLWRPEAVAYCVMHLSPFHLNRSLYRSLVALNATWVDFTAKRMNENYKLPRDMAACASLPAMLSIYNNYCLLAIRQCQSGVSTFFQQIALEFMREAPVGIVVPADTSGPPADVAGRSKEHSP